MTRIQAAGREALFVALFVGAATPAAADTLQVPGEHATIAAAVRAAAAGDTVLVAPGEYSEFIQMRNGVVLRSSDGPERTVLRTPDLGADMLEARIVECTEGIDRSTVIEGFRFEPGNRGGCGIYCESASPTIRGNVIQGFGWGINLRNSKALVEENTIEDCASFGMLVFASSPEILRNVIRNNAPFGISISGKDSFPLIGGSRENANKIYANPQAISNQTRNDIDATWNDWGWEITAIMEEKGYPYDITAITDGNDFSRAARGKGKVDYRNWIRPEEAAASTSPFAGILIPASIALAIAVALIVILRRNRPRPEASRGS